MRSFLRKWTGILGELKAVFDDFILKLRMVKDSSAESMLRAFQDKVSLGDWELRAFEMKVRACIWGVKAVFVILLGVVLVSKRCEAVEITKKDQFWLAGVVLFHPALEHSSSDSMRDWPFFAVPMPMVTREYRLLQPLKDPPKGQEKRPPFALFGVVTGRASLMDLGVDAVSTLQLSPLFSISAGGSIATGWYFGENSGTMGAYRPEKREYGNDYPFTAFGYRGFGKATVVLPVGAPFAWALDQKALYRLFLSGSYSAVYHGYTNADEGEIWRVSILGSGVNGWMHEWSAMLGFAEVYGPLKMVGIQFKMREGFSETKVDELYRASDPLGTRYGLMGMAVFKLGERHSLMAMLPVSYDRIYEGDYIEKETPLLRCTGSKWQMKMAMVMYGYEF